MEADASHRPPLAPLAPDHGHFVERGRPGPPRTRGGGADRLHAAVSRSADPLRRGRGRVPTGRRRSVELMMPVWTPGSYLVREYARNVEAVEAHAGAAPPGRREDGEEPLARSQTGGARRSRVRYRVYGREMTRAQQLGRRRLRAAQRRARRSSRSRRHARRARTRWSSSCRPPGRRRSRRMPSAPGGAATTIARPTSTRSSIPRSSPATRRSTSSPSTASRTCSSNVGEGGVWDGQRVGGRRRRRSSRPSQRFWGAIPYDGTCSST